MFDLLNFLSDGASGGSSQPAGGANSWVMIVVFAVLIVGMVLMMIIPQRKQKKAQEEMMSKLKVGCVITSIGGIVGEVVQLDDQNVWIETGVDGSKTTMKLLRQAIHSIAPAPGSAEAVAEEKAANDETDEIK